MIFVSLPITTYEPNDELDRLEIEYEPEYEIRYLNVRLDHIQMYVGMEDDTTEVWLTGHERAHTIMVNVKHFEQKMNEAIKLWIQTHT